jgi:2-amino-4-hydroxy-6-hydroxymethyldihydropteridine diphosphokinase
MNPRALIGLGSNLGDRRAILDGAVESLRTCPGVNPVGVSSYHETRPIGGPPGQGAFLNAAALLEPTLDPFQLLGVLQEIESRHGRERSVRWGERTLDLDLLLYGDTVLATPALVLPHPRFAFRRFALAPAAEVAPAEIDPLTGKSVAELLANIDRRPSLLCIDLLDRNELTPDPGPLPFVFRKAVERLGALGLSREDVPIGRCPPSNPWKRHYRRVAELAHTISRRRWTGADSPHQWVVADFCLGQDMLRGAVSVGHAALRSRNRSAIRLGLRRSMKAASRAKREALEPTLVVLIAGKLRPEPSHRYFLSPLLIPSSDDPDEMVAEIIAACEATRG